MRQAIEWGEVVHLDTASEEITAELFQEADAPPGHDPPGGRLGERDLIPETETLPCDARAHEG